MAAIDEVLAHLLRRAGFGVSEWDARTWSGLDYEQAVNRLVDYESVPDSVDDLIGRPGYLTVKPADTFNAEAELVQSKQFDPNGNLVDGLQRWQFRMVHSERPLQEKMTLFWHDHFATARSKIVEQLSFPGAVTALLSKPSEHPDRVEGQIELFRRYALGNFRDLLIEVGRNVAMVCFLDNDTNIVGKPQENFARELMELFTIGVDQFTEEDVRAAARVFTGWNLAPIRKGAEDVHYRPFQYYPNYHDTGFKSFSFPVYPDGSNTIPARPAEEGFQDGLDFMAALAAHPATGPFLARKLYRFFASEDGEPDEAIIERMAGAYYASSFEIREMVRTLLLEPGFRDPIYRWKRFSWPIEYVTRLIKEMGWQRFSADQAVFATIGMGQSLLDPPSVGGWATGRSWFSTTTMLARMNFAMATAWNAREDLATAANAVGDAQALLADFSRRFTHAPFDDAGKAALLAYLEGIQWPPDAEELASRVAGLAHLITASGEYQFV